MWRLEAITVSFYHLRQVSCWKCEQHSRALSTCYLYSALVISGSKDLLSNLAVRVAALDGGLCWMALCVAEWPRATPTITRLVGPEVGCGVLRGSALISALGYKICSINLEKNSLSCSMLALLWKIAYDLKLIMDGSLSGTGQYSSYLPLQSKFSQQHKRRPLYFSWVLYPSLQSCLISRF